MQTRKMKQYRKRFSRAHISHYFNISPALYSKSFKLHFHHHLHSWLTTLLIPQGPMRDATLEFRLSVYNAKPADEGLYTCTTPKNMVIEYNHDHGGHEHDLWCTMVMMTLPPQSHSVQLKVVDIQCSPLDVPKGFSWWRDHNDAGIHNVDVTKGLLYDDGDRDDEHIINCGIINISVDDGIHGSWRLDSMEIFVLIKSQSKIIP